ncbi:MAG: RelA/SpoT family protein [Candidatus Aminicenantes bacterium]|nr:RelA/SpoT family protein [Candidatus Aminicenantes bacterium]
MIRFDDILEKVSPLYGEKDLVPLQKAYVFAAHSHKGQVRLSGEPYLNHPLEVANILADMKLDPTTLVAALLHDVLEDTDMTALDIKKLFGEEIAHLVEGVTKIGLVEESHPETRRAETIRKIIIAMTDDLRVIFIKLADRIHNLKTLKYLSDKKQKQIAQETLEIYAPIANRLGMGRTKAELEDLSFRYVDQKNYFQILSLIKTKKKDSEKILKKIEKQMIELMKENHIPAEISSRIKRPYSIYRKMKRQNVSFDQVYDFMALRLITNTARNCYGALGIIHQNWTHLPSGFNDFISMPKPNLYQALHTTILTKKKQTIEIQIRTHEMHEISVNGIAAHWKYKETDAKSMVKEDKRLQWLREMVDLYQEQKDPRKFLKSLKTNLIPEEVYVFTPKGKVITLPMGATALDFAFKIHTEIGLHTDGAIINGKQMPLNSILEPGTIVEITSSDKKTPSRNWLNFAFTSKAQHHIKRWLNKQEQLKNISLGKKLWNKQLTKHKMKNTSLKGKALLNKIREVTHPHIRSLKHFYEMVGIGKIVLNRKLLEKILPESALKPKKETLLKKAVKKVTKKPESAIKVKGTEGSQVKLARCCSPILGESIIGYITSGKGITVHSLRCHLVKKEILPSQRMVEVSWDKSAKGDYEAALSIKAEDKPGVLAKVTSSIAKMKANIRKANVNPDSESKTRITLNIIVHDIEQLERIAEEIKGIAEVLSVARI